MDYLNASLSSGGLGQLLSFLHRNMKYEQLTDMALKFSMNFFILVVVLQYLWSCFILFRLSGVTYPREPISNASIFTEKSSMSDLKWLCYLFLQRVPCLCSSQMDTSVRRYSFL